ncbi:MAG: NRDE family protein [Gammaproteobacteria bacterium]|nr:NRDE family protein [Gammaproteobacteria bacterium]MDH5303155.1 NRDE family protein [Gammaproteobacteria bacterium]MDH5320837.1 NRDE family protein [Gammaproteobacteria bacterium]
MCLIVVAFESAAEYPLLVAANRDEFHARPSHAADWWADDKDIVGGRDLQAGGTWLGLHRSGRFAAITNYRDAAPSRRGKRSRGLLVKEFLQGSVAPSDYLRSVDGEAYAGFNLLVSDGQTLASLSNRSGPPCELAAGVYGLSNATLDTPWEKVERSKRTLNAIIAGNAVNETTLLRLLADRDKGPAHEVTSEHLPFATAHAITAPFIVLPEYGTRCSTIVMVDRKGRWSLTERRFGQAGDTTGESRFSFDRVDRQ